MEEQFEVLELSGDDWVVVEERASASASLYSGLVVSRTLAVTSVTAMRAVHKSGRLTLYEPMLFYGDSRVVYSCPERGVLLVAQGDNVATKSFYFEQVRGETVGARRRRRRRELLSLS